MEGELLTGPVMEAKEGLAGTRTGQEEAVLEDQALKKKCIMQSATNAAKDAKSLSGQPATSQFTAAIALEKMKDLNQIARAKVEQNLRR